MFLRKFFGSDLRAMGLVICLVASTASASGELKCESGDPSTWKPKSDLEAKVVEQGWTQIRKIKVDDGCYEVYGTTPEGDKVEAYFHPVSLEKLLVTRRGLVLFEKRIIFEKGAQE